MAAQQNHVKDAIVQLCRMLKYGSVYDGITPEDFRKAKLNKSEVSSTFVQLLLAILSLVLSEGESPIQPKDIPKFMKRFGYPQPKALDDKDFFQSSHDHLLCFSWLLHTSKFINAICDRALCCCKPFEQLLSEEIKSQNTKKDKPLPSKYIVSGTSSLSTDGINNEDRKTNFTTHENFSSLNLSEKSNYLTWLMGRIEISSNRLKALRMNNAKLSSVISQKISRHFKSVQDGGRDMPAVDELLFLKHPHLLLQCEKQLERKIQVLQAYLKWKDLEDFFWKWMEDGLTDKQEEEEYTTIMDELHYNEASSNKKVQVLGEKLLELKNILYEKQKIWLNKVKMNPELLKKVRVEQDLEIQKEIDALFCLVGDTQNHSQLIYSEPGDSKPFGSLPLTAQTRLLKDASLIAAEELRNMQKLWNEELCMIANMRLGGNAVVVHPPS